jgi:alkanesulfonate monooxygenase SsuD/methylene tetrahydromethanopterin reductase-like flavin-dependent oxidoreductase (luciferase family)
MKFWQSLAFVEMDQMVELATFCEELGFHGVSYGDHLITTKDQVDEYLYQDSGNILWNPDTHWPDPPGFLPRHSLKRRRAYTFCPLFTYCHCGNH